MHYIQFFVVISFTTELLAGEGDVLQLRKSLRLFIEVYMTYSMSLLVHHSRRIALLSFRPGTLKALPSLVQTILTPRHAKTGNRLYTTLCPSLKITKLREKVITQQRLASQLTGDFTGIPHSYAREMELNKEIVSKQTVQEQLEFYQSWKDQGTRINRITMLHHMAKILHKRTEQRFVLQKEREKSARGQGSAYIEVLDYISDNIHSCKPQCLTNVIWSLGKIGEKDHRLAKVCEEEILSCDISVFNLVEISQIVTGCRTLGRKHSKVFEQVEEAILDGTIKLSYCEHRQVAGLLTSFVKMDHGSVTLFEKLAVDIVEREFSSFHNGHICQFLHAFAVKGIISNGLFDKAEEEILRRSPFKLRRTEIIRVLRAFAAADKGSERLFAAFDKDIVTRRVQDYYLMTPLCWIIWSFATRGMKQSQVYRAVAREISMRGLDSLTDSDLSLCLYSYVLSEIPCQPFLKKLETEVMSRDLSCFESAQLCQVTWSCAKAGLLNPQLLQELKGDILQQKFTPYEASMIDKCLQNDGQMESKEFFSYLQNMCISSM